MNETLILPSRKEMVLGRRYLLFQLVFLSAILSVAAALLGIPLTPLTLNLCYFAVNFIVCLILLRHFLLDSAKYGLKELRRCLTVALAALGIYWVLSILLGQAILLIDPNFANINDAAISDIGAENRAVMAIGTVILVPLAEECLHRGVVFGSFYRRNRTAAYIISTVVFALIHVSGYAGTVAPLTLLLCFVQYVPAGIILAGAYEKSGSILTPILIHTVINAIGMVAMG